MALVGVSVFVMTGCSPKAGDQIVAKVGKTDVTLRDYENLYLKSNTSREQAAASTQEERERFLDLMTKFNLKLADAYASGLDTRPEIKSEIAQYKGSLVASYLTEREVNTPGIKKLYDARQVEVRAKHILIQLAPNASREDSAAAFAKADSLIALLRAGASFESLAVANSNDPSVSQNKGDLYYFTAGRMVSEFEDAAFALKAGELTPKPIRTQYGLHIIKVVDRRPSSGEIKASHIMIRFLGETPSPEDTLKAYSRIKAIQDSLKTGVDFAELAMRNSEDPGSAPRGGDLGWFQRARWIQPFDEEAFKLKPGQVSEVVRTIYGYHLIKQYEARPPKSFDEAKKEIQQSYQQTRFQTDYNKLLDKLKSQTQYSMVESAADKFVVAFDSTKTTRDSAWSSTMTPELGKQPLYKFGARAVSCDSVVAIIKSRQDMASIPLNSGALRQQLAKIAEQLIFQVKGETIEKDYPEFAGIMKEYTDGILLYQIEQERVWGRVVVNDTVLQQYFDANRDKFVWPDRVNLTSASMYNDSIAHHVHAAITGGKTLEEIVAADSIRMRSANNFSTQFAKGKATIGKDAAKTLATLGDDLKSDASLRIQIVAHPDTTSKKKQNEKLAAQRIDAIKQLLKKKYGVDDARIVTYVRPQQVAATEAEATMKDITTKKSEVDQVNGKIDIDILNRRSWFVGSVDNQVLPVATDERTLKADSLTAGGYAAPFNYRGNFTIVRLNKKEPARQKTYEEAGTEVSSSFQEFESKRLEKEWLDGLRTRFPVVEHKEVLKNAFATVQ
ncbi:MAG: peptidylprolyl isomerase [Ignavibacteriae bacterium]|nr:peptidylprolyl isomerase [Ignavibacteriota bacterium]